MPHQSSPRSAPPLRLPPEPSCLRSATGRPPSASRSRSDARLHATPDGATRTPRSPPSEPTTDITAGSQQGDHPHAQSFPLGVHTGDHDGVPMGDHVSGPAPTPPEAAAHRGGKGIHWCPRLAWPQAGRHIGAGCAARPPPCNGSRDLLLSPCPVQHSQLLVPCLATPCSGASLPLPCPSAVAGTLPWSRTCGNARLSIRQTMTADNHAERVLEMGAYFYCL